jgi:hypothetical protein
MTALTEPVALMGFVAGAAGLFLLAQARLQSKLLRARVASGVGTAIVDPATGLFSAAAAWQCVRAEANRAARLDRALDVWLGTSSSSEQLDELGKELAFQLPAGSTGVRLAPDRVCIVSCAGADDIDQLADELTWRSISVPAGEDAARAALAFISEVDADAA